MNYLPVEVILKIDIPVLFIHGKSDKSVPYTAAEVLYAAKQGEKNISCRKGRSC